MWILSHLHIFDKSVYKINKRNITLNSLMLYCLKHTLEHYELLIVCSSYHSLQYRFDFISH